jgi:hypothetical protein
MNRLTTRRFLCLKCARPCGRISENIWVKGLRQGTARQARQGGRGRRGQGLGLYDPQRRLWRGYPYRAAIAVCCLFENLPQDAVYPSFSVDSEGRPLDGSALTRRRAFNGDFLFPGQRRAQAQIFRSGNHRKASDRRSGCGFPKGRRTNLSLRHCAKTYSWLCQPKAARARDDGFVEKTDRATVFGQRLARRLAVRQ